MSSRSGIASASDNAVKTKIRSISGVSQFTGDALEKTIHQKYVLKLAPIDAYI
jgi:hypothetical protein